MIPKPPPEPDDTEAQRIREQWEILEDEELERDVDDDEEIPF